MAGECQNSITLPATLTTVEADLFVVKDFKFLEASQFTIYGSITLGGVASASFFYYYSPDSGATWFPVSLYSASTGEATQRLVLLDSGTGAHPVSGKSRFVDDLKVSGTTAFKITGLSATGTPAIDFLYVFFRNN